MLKLRQIACALLSAAAVATFSLASPAVAQDASSHDDVLGTGYTKFHPFSACNFALGAGASYGRLGTEGNLSGINSGTGSGTYALGADGVIATLGGGCDMHFGRTVVGGLLSYNFGDVGTRFGDTSIDLNKQLTIGGRLGYMIRPEWMLYSSLGITWAHATTTTSLAATDTSLKGVKFGLGSEYKIAAPVWLRLEGNATRFDKIDLGDATVNPTIYTATASVVFKF